MQLCRSCDLLYVNSAPTSDWLEATYRSAAFDTTEESHHAARTYSLYLQKLVRLEGLSTALDIGAGDGAFLRELIRLGFADVTGVEPSRESIARAPHGIRGHISPGSFCVDDFPVESFDLITCFQTIEHLRDPSETLVGAYRLLKPGGAVFLVAHNHRALPARLLGTRSPIFDVEHLQLFSPRSLRRLLQVSGFERIIVRHIVNRYPLAYWLRLLPLPSGPKSWLLRSFAERRAARWLFPLWAGNIVAVAYKPVLPSALPLEEGNVPQFNKDVEDHSRYLYTGTGKLSSVLANARISEAVLELGDVKDRCVLDVGCGDGTYTLELANAGAREVLGVDAARNAILSAKKRAGLEAGVRFEVMDVGRMKVPSEDFDLAVVRGLLHHLKDPETAIPGICRSARHVIVVEPNGLNPIVKLLERVSPYHRKHEERSFLPSLLDRWFIEAGASIEHRAFIGLVPFFCPAWLARLCKMLEPLVERTPWVRSFCCGQYVLRVRTPSQEQRATVRAC